MKVSLNPESFQIFSLLCLPRDSAFAGLVPAFMFNFKFITMLEHFFGQCQKKPIQVVDKPLTFLNATETDNNGNSVKVVKCVETSNNPYALLSFEDFSLKKMMDAGIKPQHLAIDKSVAIGVDDSVISSFESRVTELLSDN